MSNSIATFSGGKVGHTYPPVVLSFLGVISKVTDMGKRYKDLTGQVFGRLTAIEHLGLRKTRRFWLCRCSCGIEKEVVGYALMEGNTKSCGCLQSDNRYKHGQAYTSTYTTWESMKGRCDNPNNTAYADYGERGIHYVKEWREFSKFFADMGEKPEGLSLDRIDNDGNYSPENCRWATPIEQASNKRTNVYLTHDGKTQTISQWSRDKGWDRAFIGQRRNAGWSTEEILTTPKGCKRGVYE